jgi:hypothetical protein
MLAPDMARRPHQLPDPRCDCLNIFTSNPAIGGGFAMQQTHQLVQIKMCGELVAAPEIENRSVPCLAMLAISFDHVRSIPA